MYLASLEDDWALLLATLLFGPNAIKSGSDLGAPGCPKRCSQGLGGRELES